MRRSDREITSKRAIEEFVEEEQILRIALYDDKMLKQSLFSN